MLFKIWSDPIRFFLSSPDTTILPDVRIVFFFDSGGGGPGGVPGGSPGGSRGPGGVPGGGPGGSKTKKIKIYEDPKRPHNSGFWIRMTPRGGRDGREGVPGGVPGGARGPRGVPGGVPGGGPGGSENRSKRREQKNRPHL
jgi:hypothetical protein